VPHFSAIMVDPLAADRTTVDRTDIEVGECMDQRDSGGMGNSEEGTTKTRYRTRWAQKDIIVHGVNRFHVQRDTLIMKLESAFLLNTV
jgi:hypothetical protein